MTFFTKTKKNVMNGKVILDYVEITIDENQKKSSRIF